MSKPLKPYIDQLTQLVALPSVSATHAHLNHSNRPVVELLANWLSDLGFQCDIQVVSESPDKVNLIATLGEGDEGLVFAGHTDTVPYDENGWQQDPFSLTVDDNGRAFGLGATDMKGFFPTVLQAIEPYLNKPLKQPIIVIATADEESSMNGARTLVHTKRPQAKCAVIGEPTSMTPIYMHKGIAMETIRIRGQSGHSSNPALGHNTIDVMHDVLSELKAFRETLQSQYQNAGFEVDVPTLNFGCIHGGDNPNRICGHCELEFDIRPLPGMSIDSLREAIDQRLNRLAEKHRIQLQRDLLFPGVDAFEQDKHSHFIKTVEQLTQTEAQSVAFATEAPFLKELGMDVVVMGPGSIDVAHQPNEYIHLNEIEGAVKVLQGLIEKYCIH